MSGHQIQTHTPPGGGWTVECACGFAEWRTSWVSAQSCALVHDLEFGGVA